VDDNRLSEVFHSGGQSRNYHFDIIFTLVTMVRIAIIV
jgi:hypothetical protein